MAEKDIISKHLIKRIAIDMAKYLFNLSVDEAELLDTEQQRVEYRQADVLMRVLSPEQYLLHIEIQNANHPHMPQRMLRYRADIAFQYPAENVRQYLIYIGKATLTMPDSLLSYNLDYHYHIIDMRQLDCRQFLQQDTPDALVLAILCDFKGYSARDVIQHILSRLQMLCRDNESQYREYFSMLEVLSGNRNLTDMLKEENDMLSQIEVSRLASYQMGMEKGLELGLEQGLEQGEQRTKTTLISTLRLLLKAKFGVIPTDFEQRTAQASIEQLEYYLTAVVTAETLEQVFADK